MSEKGKQPRSRTVMLFHTLCFACSLVAIGFWIICRAKYGLTGFSKFDPMVVFPGISLENFLFLVVALIGIMGIFAFRLFLAVREESKERTGHSSRPLLGLLLVAGVPLFLFLGYREYTIAEMRKIEGGNLKTIACALLGYSGDNGGSFPPELCTLTEFGSNDLPTSKVYLCPGSNTPTPTTMEGMRNGDCDFIYVGSGVRDDTPTSHRTVLVFTKDPSLLVGWVNFLFVDGSVVGVPSHNPWDAIRRHGFILGPAGRKIQESK